MRVKIEKERFTAPTATELIHQIAWMHWGKADTAEEYISNQQRSYEAVTGKEMILPDGTTEERTIAMFKAITEVGGWDFSENE